MVCRRLARPTLDWLYSNINNLTEFNHSCPSLQTLPDLRPVVPDSAPGAATAGGPVRPELEATAPLHRRISPDEPFQVNRSDGRPSSGYSLFMKAHVDMSDPKIYIIP